MPCNKDTATDSPKQVFTAFLKRRHMNMTPQRRVILETFLDCSSHVTSEELYERVRKVDSKVGHATVFRTLKLLAESGLAAVVRFKDGLIRYECAYGREHHDHMICDECGKEFEVSIPELNDLLGRLAEEAGFRLTGHMTYLSGVCAQCSKKARGKD